MHLLGRIEQHLRRSGTPATTFGRRVLRDPRFVFDLRRGREPRPETAARILAWLDSEEERTTSCSR